MIKVEKKKFTKEIKKSVKLLDDEISYYTSVDISITRNIWINRSVGGLDYEWIRKKNWSNRKKK